MTTERQNTRQEGNVFSNLNDPGQTFKNPEQLLFIRTFIDILRQALTNIVRSDRAAAQIILKSPNGNSWIVEVSDTGQLTTRNARA